jgi:hypothetical protein
MTSSVQPRLFVDFNADACVVIHDRARFTRMLAEATRDDLQDTTLRDGPAAYMTSIAFADCEAY